MKLRVVAALFLSVSLTAFAESQKSSPVHFSSVPLADSSKSQGTAEGTFLRIDEGDYFHFVMKDEQGEEQSYFILKPDKSLEQVTDTPDKYVGKKCRITFQESEELLPEAGQRMKISQILSVKWLK